MSETFSGDARHSIALFVRYDDQANAAMLAPSSERRGGGPNYQLTTSSGSLRGLLRTSPDGAFDHLEVVGASSSIPGVLTQLRPALAGPPSQHTGVVRVPAEVSDDGSTTLRFSDVSAESESVRVIDRGGSLIAIVTFLNGGVLAAVQLMSVAPFFGNSPRQQ